MRGVQSLVWRRLAAASFLFAVFLEAAPPLVSQQGNSPANDAQEKNGILTFHAGTHLVVLDAVVTDKKGHPVTGLTKDDFQLSEDGHPQSIKFFEEHAPVSAAQIAADKAALARSLPPNTFTSYEPFTNNAVTLLMLNELMPVPDYDLEPLHERMVDVIQNAPPDTPFVVYDLDSQLHLVQPTTTNRELLLAAIERLWKNQHFPVNQPPTKQLVLARRDTFTGILHKLDRSLESIPGRKTLFTFTGGLQCSIVASNDGNCLWPLGHEQGESYLCTVMDILEQARISIYRYYPGGQVLYGFGCRDRPDDLRHIFDTASNYYTLYYTPTNGDWSGRYRKFKVSMADKNLHLSYREGYYGLPENADARRGNAAAMPGIGAGAKSTAIAAARVSGETIQPGPSEASSSPSSSALDPTPVVFTVQIEPAAALGTGPQATPPSPGNAKTEALRLQGYRDYSIHFLVPARGLRLTPKSASSEHAGPAAYTARLQVAAVSYIQGSPADAKSIQITANFDGLNDPRIANGAITATLSIQVPEYGKRLLQLTVRDVATDQFGRLDVPVEKIVLPAK